MSIYDQFDREFNNKELLDDIASASQGGSGNYEEVPDGMYEVAVEKMELKASKKGDPMVSIWFRIVSGDHEKQVIFMNQVITQGFQIHIVNELLRSLAPEDMKVEFTSYNQYNNLILDVHEAIQDKFEYGLKYGHTKKGFATFEITDVFELD